MQCNWCKGEFEGRKDAKYCSAKCRKASSRAKCDISVTDVVTDKPIEITEDNLTEAAFSIPDVEGKFEDLPPDVQRAIEYMSKVRSENLGIDYEDEKAMRTARALRYQRMYPDR